MQKDFVETITYAAAQSDRWMFVALLGIGLGAVSILFRFFTKRLDAIQHRMDLHTEDFIIHLKTANREMLTVIAAAQEVISRNSQIMERVERKLESLK
jgi:hypothetical protein